MTRVMPPWPARWDLPIGVNVLRNDARGALAIAAAVGAAFIRINVRTGAMKRGGRVDAPVDQKRVERIVRAFKASGGR